MTTSRLCAKMKNNCKLSSLLPLSANKNVAHRQSIVMYIFCINLFGFRIPIKMYLRSTPVSIAACLGTFLSMSFLNPPSFAQATSIPAPSVTPALTPNPLLQPSPQPAPTSAPPSMPLGNGYRVEVDPSKTPPAAIVSPGGSRIGPTVNPEGGGGVQITIPTGEPPRQGP